MARRVVHVVALGLAIVLAVGAGRLVRNHLESPDPVSTVRAATMAYATGDCDALRKLMIDPDTVDCDAVTNVRDAYRDEGLRPSTFTYDVVARSDEGATVRISYKRGKDAEEELVRVQLRGDEWRVAPAPPAD